MHATITVFISDGFGIRSPVTQKKKKDTYLVYPFEECYVK